MRKRQIVALLIAVFSLTACGGGAGSDDGAPPSELASANVDDPTHAPVEPFTPPSPPGCGGAGAYDYCFAFDRGTPLALRIDLAKPTPEDAVGRVRFHRAAGDPAAVLNEVSFALPASKTALVYYFQVYPATYTIDVDVSGAQATTAPLEISDAPIETWLSVAAP